MVVSLIPQCDSASRSLHSPDASLLRGEILLETSTHTAWGAAVTAQMLFPLERHLVWQQLIDYPRWTQYFLDITQSHVLEADHCFQADGTRQKRLYQAASKNFLFITAQVEVCIQVTEFLVYRIQFEFESGSFIDFGADLKLRDFPDGTLLTYAVHATPLIPIPSLLIQQAIHLDLPANMRHLRKVLCASVAAS